MGGPVALGRVSGRPALLWQLGGLVGGIFNTNVPNDTIAHAHAHDCEELYVLPRQKPFTTPKPPS
jgi:hypothetical protein